MRKITLLTAFSIIFFNAICYGMTDSIPSIQAPTSRRSLLGLIALMGWLILIISIFIPIARYVFFLFKIRNEELSDEEKKEKSKILFKKFLKEFFILGGIGFIVQLVSGWITPIAKPIIYLYPEKEEKIKVKLGKKETLTCTYPKYKDEWNVVAMPNGDLTDMETGRSFYALYWEGKNLNEKLFENGFCVKCEDSIKFLEEKLEILGLNEREANEFIVYWLPRLESNKYNLIKFICNEEMNEYMPLEINPKPNTIIRVMMQFKGINKEKEIKEQELKSIERKGFTVVEWGGTEVK